MNKIPKNNNKKTEILYFIEHINISDAASQNMKHTSDITESSEGLTSTTVSRTSLLWWSVLCPGGKENSV